MKRQMLLIIPLLFSTMYAESTITHYGVKYKEVKSTKTGRVWLDRNLGAKRVCLSANDKQCFGDYYQWGRNTDGHEKLTSRATKNKIKNLNNSGKYFIDSGYNSHKDWPRNIDTMGKERQKRWSQTNGNSICPKEFRVPTVDELRKEIKKSNISTASDIFKSFLKIPLAGRRDYYGTYNNGSFGTIWTNSLSAASFSKILYFDNSDGIDFGSTNRGFGFNVRCIKEK